MINVTWEEILKARNLFSLVPYKLISVHLLTIFREASAEMICILVK